MSWNKTGYPKSSFMLANSDTTAGTMGVTVFADELVVSKGPNYCVDVGAANALVATISAVIPGIKVHPYVGMSVIVKTSAALQAGVNTFNLNGHGTNSIVKQSNYAGNLQTIIAAGAMLELVFDGTRWQAVGY
jgi:hypothetical protein